MTAKPVRMCGRLEGLAMSFTARPWPSKRITWSLDVRGFTGGLSAQQLQQVFEEAWADWADRLDILPVYVNSSAGAMVQSKFGDIDGSRNVLAYSELADGTTTPKHQVYDDAEAWSWQEHPTQQIDLQRVACHEIGHVLGLVHDNDNAQSLMAPMYSETIRGPQQRDIDRMLMLGYRERPVVAPVDPDAPPPVTPTTPPVTPPTPTIPGGSMFKTIVDSVFATLEKQYAGKPVFLMGIKLVHSAVLSWLTSQGLAFTLPGGLNKQGVKDAIDKMFAMAEKFYADNGGHGMVAVLIEGLHQTALMFIDAIVQDLRTQGLTVTD